MHSREPGYEPTLSTAQIAGAILDTTKHTVLSFRWLTEKKDTYEWNETQRQSHDVYINDFAAFATEVLQLLYRNKVTFLLMASYWKRVLEEQIDVFRHKDYFMSAVARIHVPFRRAVLCWKFSRLCLRPANTTSSRHKTECFCENNDNSHHSRRNTIHQP